MWDDLLHTLFFQKIDIYISNSHVVKSSIILYYFNDHSIRLVIVGQHHRSALNNDIARTDIAMRQPVLMQFA